MSLHPPTAELVAEYRAASEAYRIAMRRLMASKEAVQTRYLLRMKQGNQRHDLQDEFAGVEPNIIRQFAKLGYYYQGYGRNDARWRDLPAC